MKRLLLAVVFLLMPMAVFAADMQLKARPMALATTDVWAGFYIGVHGGAAWSHENLDTGLLREFSIGELKPSGSVFGAQAGHLWQYGTVVAGFEIDYSHLGFKDEKVIEPVIRPTEKLAVLEKISAGVRVRDLASARARLGLAFGPIMGFVTAGPAWGNADAFVRAGDDGVTSSASSWGWSAGGGLEYQLMANVFLRGEYLHYDLGKADFTFEGLSAQSRFHVDVARAALSWHFN